jgi:hypothetical protein
MMRATPAPEEAQLMSALEAVHRAIFKYPMAIQAAFGALVAEGRRYAQTEDGAILCDRLARAREMGRARLLWDVLSLSAFTEQSEGPLPSVFADTLVRALRSRHLEPLLSKVLERRS